MRSRCASKSFAEVETGNLKPRRSLATRMKSRILTVERSLSEAPSHTELSNGPVWIFLCSSRKRTKVAATASFKLFRLGNVLRTLSDSTFSKKTLLLGRTHIQFLHKHETWLVVFSGAIVFSLGWRHADGILKAILTTDETKINVALRNLFSNQNKYPKHNRGQFPTYGPYSPARSRGFKTTDSISKVGARCRTPRANILSYLPTQPLLLIALMSFGMTTLRSPTMP